MSHIDLVGQRREDPTHHARILAFGGQVERRFRRQAPVRPKVVVGECHALVHARKVGSAASLVNEEHRTIWIDVRPLLVVEKMV